MAKLYILILFLLASTFKKTSIEIHENSSKILCKWSAYTYFSFAIFPLLARCFNIQI